MVFNRAPRLRDKPYEKAVGQLLLLSPVRSLASWEPRGKGRDTLFRSLAEHLLAKYPVPAVLWSGFFEDDVRLFAPMVAHVAGGGSLYDFVKSFPVPLTRKMCHDLLATSSEYRLLRDIRRVEVRAVMVTTVFSMHGWARIAVVRFNRAKTKRSGSQCLRFLPRIRC